ncbi:hypothetical protein [Acidipropionibacterium virtanenii]|uniref:Uncharacterized protein n=1 Tax=Acidipropionibacterium virtanenii TaxID=2057246 RepID=A0A344UV24_9ACTN|nr:hypothetical protein [Acidipropionibacterium virtanenii]AXE39122.1 hypothetical protein JS278_01966 [Acidipropionibacterium virtanenii]
MRGDKQAVLAGAPAALNRPDQPWEVMVDGDSIVARWKWMDARFFSPQQVNDEVRQYTFTATLTDRGTWKESDKKKSASANVRFEGGKVSFGKSTSGFRGKTTEKSFEFGVGKNRQTGEVGAMGFAFDTSAVKRPVRDYLSACGWKKAGLFG